MIQDTVENLREEMPKLLSGILDNASMDNIEYQDDIAVLTYDLHKQFELEDIKEIFKHKMVLKKLYHFVPSEHTTYGQQVCVYTDCTFGYFFKVHVTTNGAGMVHMLTVTIFDSMETMCVDIIEDLLRHEGKGRFRSKRDKADILVEFC